MGFVFLAGRRGGSRREGGLTRLGAVAPILRNSVALQGMPPAPDCKYKLLIRHAQATRSASARPKHPYEP